ncbi:hypothetical protein B0H14DRAFT_516896 [Mycena olivaceomarginata]|nr:hypothetical protein B0H14DRAFT_516896 [Mycena olivaceomarginata]
MSCLRRKRPQKDRNDERSASSVPHELVDECLSYLDSTTLKACALVCRSWAISSQRLLFKTASIDSTRRCRRLEKRLRTSSCLVRYIHQLRFFSTPTGLINSTTFKSIVNLPFTHLESVHCLGLGILTHEIAIALQGLFSLPTLRRVVLDGSFVDPAPFFAIWDRCSPTLRHLQLLCTNRSGDSTYPLGTLTRSAAPVVITSLQLCS